MRIAIVWEAPDGPAKQAGIQAALDALTALDAEYLRANPRTPSLYTSGVVWQRETPDHGGHNEERFLAIPYVLQLGWGDCDDIACWRAAELRVKGDRDARAVVYAVRPGLWHVIVRNGQGATEDPSRRLGMTGAG